MKYIAKPNTWFKEGTECILIECLYDSVNDKHGIFEGVRICEDYECEGGVNTESGIPYHQNGQEYWSNEICSYSEFEIIQDTEESAIAKLLKLLKEDKLEYEDFK